MRCDDLAIAPAKRSDTIILRCPQPHQLERAILRKRATAVAYVFRGNRNAVRALPRRMYVATAMAERCQFAGQGN